MDEPPAQIIRALREALDMSRAEFARAAGWTPATISRWERGKSRPSRIALKTILAFAEERGVRYRPPPTSLPVPRQRHTDEPPFRDAEAPVWEASLPTPLRSSAERPPAAPVLSLTTDRPRWSAEANLRVALWRSGARPANRLHDRVWKVGVLAALVGLAVVVGLPRRSAAPPRAERTRLHAPSAFPAFGKPAASERRAKSARRPGSQEAPRDDTHVVALADAPATGAAAAPEPAFASSTDEMAAPADTRAPVARLESVVLVGRAQHATFRIGAEALTVVPGDWVGSVRVDAIEREGVRVVGADGTTRTVSLGDETALE